MFEKQGGGTAMKRYDYIVFVRGTTSKCNCYPGVFCEVQTTSRKQAESLALQRGPNIYNGQWLEALPWSACNASDRKQYEGWREIVAEVLARREVL
jgi:hypothetical protein